MAGSRPSRLLRLAATDWPPYSIGSDRPQPGIAHEFLDAQLSRLGWRLEVQYLPWSRALQQAREGRRSDGLLTAVASEAAGLLLSRQPSFSYEVVFYTRADSRWRYRGPASLPAMRLGVIADYGYGADLDAYLADPASSGRLLRLTGDNTTSRLLRLLAIGRIDAFVEDRVVVEWTAAVQGIALHGVREAGALPPQPVYLALNPDLAEASALLGALNRQLAEAGSRAAFDALRQRYLNAATAGSAGSGS